MAGEGPPRGEGRASTVRHLKNYQWEVAGKNRFRFENKSSGGAEEEEQEKMNERRRRMDCFAFSPEDKGG